MLKPLFQAACVVTNCVKSLMGYSPSLVEPEKPKNVFDCIRLMDAKFTEEEKQIIINQKEGFFFGMGMRNNWGLWGHNELVEWFWTYGIWHADDMSGIITDSYVKFLKGEVICIEDMTQRYFNHWERYGLNCKEELAKAKKRLNCLK